MPKPAKIILGLLVGYVGLIVAFESMIGIFQPEQGQVLTITTTGDDGTANNRVLAWLDDDGTVFVSANHWPRAWYKGRDHEPAGSGHDRRKARRLPRRSDRQRCRVGAARHEVRPPLPLQVHHRLPAAPLPAARSEWLNDVAGRSHSPRSPRPPKRLSHMPHSRCI